MPGHSGKEHCEGAERPSLNFKVYRVSFKGAFGANFLGFFLEKFWNVFEILLAYFWAPWAPQGPQNGPRDPGDRFKIDLFFEFFQKFGPEVSTIFEILIFSFWGVF